MVTYDKDIDVSSAYSKSSSGDEVDWSQINEKSTVLLLGLDTF